MADALDRLRMQRMIESEVMRRNRPGRFGQLSINERGRQQRSNSANANDLGLGYGGRPGTMMSSSPSSAAESAAFNERKKNLALYGKYGKGGLERERMAMERKRMAMDRTSKREGLQSARDIADLQGQTRRDIAGMEAKTQARENLGRYGGMDEWGRPVEGTENIRVNRSIARDPIFKQFETPNPLAPLTPLKTLGRYNRRTGQFEPMELSTSSQERNKGYSFRDYLPTETTNNRIAEGREESVPLLVDEDQEIRTPAKRKLQTLPEKPKIKKIPLSERPFKGRGFGDIKTLFNRPWGDSQLMRKRKLELIGG